MRKDPDYRLGFLFFWSLIVGALLMGSVMEADADDYVVFNGKSWHQIEGEWNEENWGAGFESNQYRDGYKFTYSVGGYVDSNSDTAYYAGLGYEYQLGDSNWYAGATAQITNREDLYEGDLGPMAYLSASYDGDPVGINIVWVPTIVVGVQFKVAL